MADSSGQRNSRKNNPEGTRAVTRNTGTLVRAECDPNFKVTKRQFLGTAEPRKLISVQKLAASSDLFLNNQDVT